MEKSGKYFGIEPGVKAEFEAWLDKRRWLNQGEMMKELLRWIMTFPPEDLITLLDGRWNELIAPKGTVNGPDQRLSAWIPRRVVEEFTDQAHKRGYSRDDALGVALRAFTQSPGEVIKQSADAVQRAFDGALPDEPVAPEAEAAQELDAAAEPAPPRRRSGKPPRSA